MCLDFPFYFQDRLDPCHSRLSLDEQCQHILEASLGMQILRFHRPQLPPQLQMRNYIFYKIPKR